MSAGAPFCGSKKTLCATEPNANVTLSPAWIVMLPGVNARPGVASTVLPLGGAVTSLPPPEPQPYASSTAVSVVRLNLVLGVNMAFSAQSSESSSSWVARGGEYWEVFDAKHPPAGRTGHRP